MARPFVVIVGRPNVGKSTLFNRISKTRSAIVEDFPGVTRDRNYLPANWEDKPFVIVDTGGFYPDPPEDLFVQAKEQALFAINEGDVIIHLLDGKDGLTPADMELARLLRTSGKKVMWAVNKIDAPTREDRTYDFYRIGADQIWPISSVTGYGFEDFMDKLTEMLPKGIEEPVDYPGIAVVGRPNAGKSTLVNSLIGKKRMLVSPEPGTTRDSIDSTCAYHGKKYLLIDTAGLRKKGRAGYPVERFAMARALKSIERCDIAIIVIDASEGVTEQDIRIAGLVKDHGKGAVVLLNKWDVVPGPDEAFKKIVPELQRKMWFLQFAPVLTVSGLVKKRITKVFPVIDRIMKERAKRISTASLNRFFAKIVADLPLPLYRQKKTKIYYMTQAGSAPPAFVIFANYPEAIRESHLRYIERALREEFTFEGTPIRLIVRSRRTEPRK